MSLPRCYLEWNATRGPCEDPSSQRPDPCGACAFNAGYRAGRESSESALKAMRAERDEARQAVLEAHEGRCWEGWQMRTASCLDPKHSCDICREMWPHKPRGEVGE